MKTYSNKLVSLLVERDDITPEEANELILETKRLMIERVAEGQMMVDDIIMDNLGLETDYIFDVLDY